MASEVLPLASHEIDCHEAEACQSHRVRLCINGVIAVVQNIEKSIECTLSQEPNVSEEDLAEFSRLGLPLCISLSEFIELVRVDVIINCSRH